MPFIEILWSKPEMLLKEECDHVVKFLMWNGGNSVDNKLKLNVLSSWMLKCNWNSF